MEYVLAIGYMETIILNLKAKKKNITNENIENDLNILLDTDREIIKAYIKVALYNLKRDKNKVTVRTMESQIQYLKDLYTVDKLLEVASNLKEN